MTRYLRMVRRARWSCPSWIADPVLAWQGDALGDLCTTKNMLSVYLADTQDRIDQVVAALAANRTHLSNLDYTLIAEDLLSQMNLRTEQVNGKTLHRTVNRLHHDIQNLTASNVFALMESVTAENVTRVPKTKVKALLQRAIQDGHIDSGRLQPKLAQSLEK